MPVSAEVATLFLQELARRNIPVRVGADGGYEIELHGGTATVSLDNLSRDFERDRDPDRIVTFVDSILTRLAQPSWDEARPRIRWSLEPTDMPLEDALHDRVSDQVALVLVYVSPAETKIMWLSPGLVESWGKTRDELFEAAVENMRAILADTRLRVEDVEVTRLGILETDHTAFKAALLCCPGLKELVEPVLGWPVLAVAPCRDFVYLIPGTDGDALGQIGPVVVREYQQSGYPLCTEVFEVTDQGIRAIGEFQRQPGEEEEEEADADGMKPIRYRGGTVIFRVPAHWEEEYGEEGGGTFYDAEADTGTLRLSTLVVESEEPVTTDTGRALLAGRRQEGASGLIDLGGGNVMITYTTRAEEEEDEPLAIRYWEIANPVPPNHVRIALFSYAVEADRLADEDVADELALVEREILQCRFAPVIGTVPED